MCKCSPTFQTFPILYCTYSQAVKFVPQERKTLTFLLAKAEPDVNPEELCKTKDGVINVLLQLSLERHPELPDVPTVLEIARNEEERAAFAFISSITGGNPPDLCQAWDNWIGRGVRRNHAEDYPEYLKGCDIASFDIYPAVHESPEVAGKLEFVARGVERLSTWTAGNRSVWSCIEASRIGNTRVKPSPQQVRAEVWMAIMPLVPRPCRVYSEIGVRLP